MLELRAQAGLQEAVRERVQARDAAQQAQAGVRGVVRVQAAEQVRARGAARQAQAGVQDAAQVQAAAAAAERLQRQYFPVRKATNTA